FQDNAASGDPVPQDTPMGGLAQIPGARAVAATVTDASSAFTGGVATLFNADAGSGSDAKTARTLKSAAAPHAGGDLSTFGSAHGRLDSDAIKSGTDAILTVTTGEPGTSDHSFDVGFTGTGGGTGPTLTLGDRVFKDINNNGTLDAGETGVSGVIVDLLDAAGT